MHRSTISCRVLNFLREFLGYLGISCNIEDNVIQIGGPLCIKEGRWETGRETGREERWDPRACDIQVHPPADVTSTVFFDINPVGKLWKVIDSFPSIK